MFRHGLTRSLKAPVSRHAAMLARSDACRSFVRASSTANLKFRGPTASERSAMTRYAPQPRALLRYNSTTSTPPPHHLQNRELEKRYEAQGMNPHPDEVSVDSSVRHVFSEQGDKSKEDEDVDMLASVKSDLRTIKEVFALHEVPREAMVLGMLGVLPYLATSVATLYLTYDLNHAAAHGYGVLLDPETAKALYNVLEPLQIGWGAVIISFLGAIHWGFEWAHYHGTFGWQRYKVGLIAPAIAWPTLLLPAEQALICQFLAFLYLYYQDSMATKHAMAPSWYGMYRFVLTFFAGASIVLSLIGRGQLSEYVGHPDRPADKVTALRHSRAQYLEMEEEEKRKRAAEEDEEGDEDEEEGDGDEDGESED